MAHPKTVMLSVIGEGQILSAYERDALEHETAILQEKDPTTSLGFYMARLLARAVGGSLDVDERDGETDISIVLDREAATDSASEPVRGGIGKLATVALVALFAGGVMGGYVHFAAGKIAVIGALYGTENALVGLLTHEFHSVVFGLIYGAFLAILPSRYTQGVRQVGVSAPGAFCFGWAPAGS